MNWNETIQEMQGEPMKVDYVREWRGGAPRPSLVILESPYASRAELSHERAMEIEANVRYARAAVRDSVLRGEAPIASHLLFTQPGILDDNIPEHRALGIAAGLAWLRVAEASVVYADRGISAGMEAGIDAAVASGVPVKLRLLFPERLVQGSELARRLEALA